MNRTRLSAGLIILVAFARPLSATDIAGNVAGAVLRGDLSQARAMLESASDAASSPVVAGLRRSLQIVQQMDGRILSSFNVDQGQLLNVELISGTENVQVRHVEGTSVRVVRRVGTDDASEWTITLDQLAPAEKLRRLGTGSGPEINLLRGLVAWGGRDRTGAVEYLRAAAPDPLAAALVDQLSQASRQKAETLAQQDLVRLLALVGLPPQTALDKQTASVIRRRTFSEKSLGRIRSAATAFRAKHAGTEAAKLAEVVAVELERVDTVAREIDVAMIDAAIEKAKQTHPSTELKFERKVTREGAELVLANNPGLTNIAAFEGLPFVRLNLSGTGVAEIGPLRRMPLQDLNLAGCPVADLSALAGAPLSSLDLSGTAVKDLSPIQDAPLQHLSLAKCAGIKDLSAVLKLKRLRVLVLPSPDVDSTMLRGHTGIKAIGYDAAKVLPAADFWAGGVTAP